MESVAILKEYFICFLFCMKEIKLVLIQLIAIKISRFQVFPDFSIVVIHIFEKSCKKGGNNHKNS